eukprot:10713107-Karenia_brevis.AAC.1
MVAEQIKRTDEDLVKLVSLVVQGLLPQIKGDTPRDKSDDREKKSKSVLEEKSFWRMDKFVGDSSAYRMWMFNFTVAIGQVDGKLSDEIR